MIAGLFVTGTDTGVGKTRIAAAIVRNLRRTGHRVGAVKPVATSATSGPDGKLLADDTRILRDALEDRCDFAQITPLVYPGDVAPSVAARLSGQKLLHAEVLRGTFASLDQWAKTADVVVVEGVGGLLCPLAEDSTVLDLALTLDFPMLIVARRGLGTLNHTLMTIAIARLRGLRIAGVILNGAEPTTNHEAEATNPDELSRRMGGVPLLGDLAYSENSQAPGAALLDVDWWEMAQPSRLAWSRSPAEPSRP